MQPLLRPGIAVMLVLLAWIPAVAQQHRASIRGIVLGASSDGLPNVELRVMNEATREARRTTTDGRGRYTVAALPPGTYRVIVEHAGYGRFIARATRHERGLLASRAAAARRRDPGSRCCRSLPAGRS